MADSPGSSWDRAQASSAAGGGVERRDGKKRRARWTGDPNRSLLMSRGASYPEEPVPQAESRVEDPVELAGEEEQDQQEGGHGVLAQLQPPRPPRAGQQPLHDGRAVEGRK